MSGLTVEACAAALAVHRSGSRSGRLPLAVRQARRNHIAVEVGRRPQVLRKPALVADLDQRVCVPIKFHVVAIDTGCVVGARGVVVHGIGVVAAVAIAEGATAVVDVGLRVVIAGRLVDAAGEETTTVIAACKRVEVHSQRVVAPGKDAGHAPAYGFVVVVAGRRIQTGRIAARAAAIVTSRIGVVIAEAGVRAPGVGATAVVVCRGLTVVAGAFVRAAQHFEGVAHAVAIGIGQARAIAIQFWFRVHATAIGVGHQGAEVASCRIVATETGVEIAAAVVQCCAGIVVTGRLVGAARQAVVIANAVAIEVGCAAAATGTHCVCGIACTIARPFGNVLATAIVDDAGTVAHAASVVVAHALVHVVAEAVAIGIGCTTATTDAECIELVAGAIAISGSDSSAATVVDGARAVADAAVVGLPHAIVVAVVIADAVAIRVLQAGAATHVEGVELVAFAVAISLGKGGSSRIPAPVPDRRTHRNRPNTGNCRPPPSRHCSCRPSHRYSPSRAGCPTILGSARSRSAWFPRATGHHRAGRWEQASIRRRSSTAFGREQCRTAWGW